MKEIALYHPYVDFRDDHWLMLAILHWPKIARIRPNGYVHWRETDIARRLREECNFVVNITPDFTKKGQEVDKLVLSFLERYGRRAAKKYGIKALGIDSSSREFIMLREPDTRLEEIHPNKMAPGVIGRLKKLDLLVDKYLIGNRSTGGGFVRYVAMHPKLAHIYLAILADHVARDNEMTTITDQPTMQASTAGWTIERMAQMILDDATVLPVSRDNADIAQAFTIMAFQTVLPRGLHQISIDRVIEARKRLLPQMTAYREYLNSLSDRFAEIAELPDPDVRSAKLELMVGSEIRDRLGIMEREIGRLGLQPIRAIFSIQSLTPPALIGVLGNAIDIAPVITATTVAAGCLVGASANAMSNRSKVRQSHPAGYLLSIKSELNPVGVVAHTRRAFRRAAGKYRSAE
jgi:hypothetical protein